MADKKIEELDPNFAQPGVEGDLQWHDIREWGIEGRGWKDTQSDFDRLPLRAKGIVRDGVWSLSRHSSGLCVRFATNAASINARFRLRSDGLAMPHMPATGVSGLDLYIHGDKVWHWVGAGRPVKFPDNEVRLAAGAAQVAQYTKPALETVVLSRDPGSSSAKVLCHHSTGCAYRKGSIGRDTFSLYCRVLRRVVVCLRGRYCRGSRPARWDR